jgi:hypothetical protein
MGAAEREKAAAEKVKAEAALREAKAREPLADAAERAAANPPRPQTINETPVSLSWLLCHTRRPWFVSVAEHKRI